MFAFKVSGGRRFAAFVLSIGLAAGGLLSPGALPQAVAGPTDLVSGIVYSDANGNGTIDNTGVVGTSDVGVAGVKVTLRDTSLAPTDPNYAGWSVTTSATGAWNFPLTGAWASSPGPFQVTIDAKGVSNDAYTVEAKNGWSTVTGNAQQLISATFPATTTALQLGDAELTPAWNLQLAVPNDPSGWNGLNVLTGAAPWDAVSNSQGEDASPGDDIIRSGDQLMMNWTVTAAAKSVALGNETGPVVLEQTVTLNNGAMVTFARLPGSCVTGSTPASEVRAKPSNAVVAPGATPPAGTTSLVLTCNLGNMGTAADTPSGYIVPVSLEPLGTSPADSTFSTSARVYAVAANGAAVATPADSPVSPGPFTVTSAPRFDIEKRPILSYWGNLTINGVVTPVYRLYYRILISTDRKTGIESLGNSVQVVEDFWAQTPNAGNAVLPNLTWYIESCSPTTNTTTTQYIIESSLSQGAGAADPLGLASVTSSGTCSVPQTVNQRGASDPTAPVTLTFNNIDSSGGHFPTRTIGSAVDNLANGPYYVAAYTLIIDIPISELDRADGDTPNQAGTLGFYNQLTGFDPPGVSGVTSNYGTGFEPGYCPVRAPGGAYGQCDLMPNGTKSNNNPGPTTVNYPVTGSGAWYVEMSRLTTAWTDGRAYLPSSVYYHYDDGLVAPGSVIDLWQRIYDNSNFLGTNPFDASQGLGVCNVFDNSVAKLAPLNGALGLTAAQAALLPPNTYWQVIDVSPTFTIDQAHEQAFQAHWTVEYGHIDLSPDVANNGVFDAPSGRFNGVWTTQRNFRCTDAATTWYSSPDLVPGGVDAVNVVRVHTSDSFTTSDLRFHLGLQQRDTFYTYDGVDTGVEIPAGTVMAVFGQPLIGRIATTLNWGWNSRLYVPQPVNGYNDGDRWTVARATAALNITTIKGTLSGVQVGDGVAGIGLVGSAQAGRPVIWSINAGITPASGAPAVGTVNNVVVTVTLPKAPTGAGVPVTYNPSKTAQLVGGTPADGVVTNADGSVTLTWNLGPWDIATPIPPRIIYTDSDPMAAAGTQVVLSGTVRSSSISTIAAMNATHTVVLDQPGSVQVKLATDGTQYLTDTVQGYTATVRNFSQSLAIQAPVIYDELPAVGDADSPVAARSPASSFSGVADLTGPVTAVDLNNNPVPGTVYYWTCTNIAMPQRPEDDTAAVASCWKTSTDLGGDLSSALGWKFKADVPLDKVGTPGSVITLHFNVQPLGNKAGDLYANRFTAFSDTLKQGEYQVLASNETLAGVLGFALGDLIWEDVDYDGVYTEGVDHPVPAGVVVQVFNAANQLVDETVTDANGRWIVNALPATTVSGTLASGQYYVVIPASQFATGAILADWRASIHNVRAPDANANETVDHSAVDIAGGGVRSQGLITLNATVNATTHVVTSGGEPLGDNVKGLATTPLATDDYTNFTLDLALEGVYGTFQVAKAWTGAAPAWKTASPVYGGTWTCTHSGATVASGNWLIQGTGDATMTSTFGPVYTEIPSGSVCSAVESSPDTTEFPSTAWSWLAPMPSSDVTIATFQTKRVTITNHAARATGDFNVVKAWSGSIPAWVATTTFTGTWACVNAAEAIDASGTWSVVGLGPATLTGLPVAGLPAGTTCTAAEDVDTTSGLPTAALPDASWVWGTPTIDPTTPVTVVTGTPAIVTVTNLVGGYSFSKLADPPAGSVKVGAPITYTLLGENTGDEPLTVTVDDDLSAVLNHATLTTPPAVTILGGDGTNVPTDPTMTGTALAWSGTLAPGEKVQITYTVTVKNDAWAITIVNAATSVATTEDGQQITGQGSVTHTTPPKSNTGGALASGPSAWLPPVLLLLTGLGIAIYRRRYTTQA